MRTWNYRLVRRKANDYEYYNLIEVYYNKDGSIWLYSDPVKLKGYEDPRDLLNDLDKFKKACEDSVIDEEDLPKEETNG